MKTLSFLYEARIIFQAPENPTAPEKTSVPEKSERLESLQTTEKSLDARNEKVAQDVIKTIADNPSLLRDPKISTNPKMQEVLRGAYGLTKPGENKEGEGKLSELPGGFKESVQGLFEGGSKEKYESLCKTLGTQAKQEGFEASLDKIEDIVNYIFDSLLAMVSGEKGFEEGFQGLFGGGLSYESLSKNQEKYFQENYQADPKFETTKEQSEILAGMRSPFSNYVTTSPYGMRHDPMNRANMKMHNGIDIVSSEKPPTVHAAQEGVVKYAGDRGDGHGNMVIIDHGNGVETRYAHLSQIGVRAGEKTSLGQPVGIMGTTGHSTGPHLHYGVFINGKTDNPQKYLR